MRSTIIIIGSALVLAIAFGVYIMTQSAPAAQQGGITQPVPTSAPAVGNQALHPGDDVWLKSFDGTSQFRASTYTPHPDGTIDMVLPQAQFFMGGGAMMTIDGETGTMVAQNATSGKVQGQSMQPTRGTMQHVILRQYKAAGDKEPQFTCWLNNLAFDNETFTIATADCDIPDANGEPVHTPADQVPVHVVGIDYDFDGRGLYIKYDERDRKLQRLEIAHGEKLVIKHPSQQSQSQNSSQQIPSTTTPPIPMPLSAAPPFLINSEIAGVLKDHGSDGGQYVIQLASADPNAGINEAAGQITPVQAPAAQGMPPTRKPPTTRPAHPVRKRSATRPATHPTSAPVIKRSKDASPYRATFYDNVHVTQLAPGVTDSDSPEQTTVATADRMNADFFMGGSSTTRPSTTQSDALASSTQPTVAVAAGGTNAAPTGGPDDTHPRATGKSHRVPVTRPTLSGGVPTTGAATGPATRPAEPPIVVRWTGKLIVVPPPADAPPMSVGDSALELVGDSEPAVLNRGGSVIHCASFRYNTLHQIVALRSTAELPQVTIVNADGTRIVAPWVDYDGFNATADIPGPAHAEFKVADSSTQPSTAPTTSPVTHPASVALVDWADHCHLQLAPGDRENLLLKEAVLDGNVHVDHPQVKLVSDELDLGFDEAKRMPATAAATAPTTPGNLATASTKPTTRPATESELRRMDSSGNVDCTLVDSQGKNQHILADHLTMETARDAIGQVTPSKMTADGDVQTFNDTQLLIAGHLVALLEPATRPSRAVATTQAHGAKDNSQETKLRDLVAEDSVHFQTTAGDFADADQLHVGEAQDIDLFGQPIARVGDKDTTITGPIIRYDPAGKQARVFGAGTLYSVSNGDKATTKSSATTHPATTRPLQIRWAQGMFFDGLSNLIHINGDVHTKTLSADGTLNTADGDHILMTMIDAPTTRPTTQSSTQSSTPSSVASAAKPPSSQPAGVDGMMGGPQANFMKDKLISVITLFAKPNEKVEVKSRTDGPDGKPVRLLDLFAPRVNYDKINDRFIVPTAGRMLVEDLKKDSTTKPAAGQQNNDSPGAGGMKGTTAFEWQKDLVYDQKIDQAIMTGNTHVVHQGAGASGYELYADQIITDLDPNKPTTRPATMPTATIGTATQPPAIALSTNQPAATQPAETDSMKVKRLTAIGSVRMISTRMQFTATQAVYDPQTQTMTAHGTAQQPVELFDNQGLSTGTFDSIEYNTKTDQIKQLINAHTALRR